MHEIIEHRYDHKRLLHCIKVKCWPRFTFYFTPDGQDAGVEPMMNFRSDKTRNTTFTRIWDSFKKLQEELGVGDDPFIYRYTGGGSTNSTNTMDALGYNGCVYSEKLKREFSKALLNNYRKEEKEMNGLIKGDLVEILGAEKDEDRYGFFMTFDRSGRALVEMRENGNFVPHDADKIKKVMPYTVAVRYGNNSNTYHFKAVEGSVEVGDIVILENEGTMVTVVELDTESDRATRKLVGRKVATTAIG